MKWLVVLVALVGCRGAKEELGVGFCDSRGGAEMGWPEFVGAAAPGKTDGWRWVNVWATYCEPCVTELPKLVAWRDQLAKAGRRVEFTFVNVDPDDEDVATFVKKHPDTPASLRLAKPETAMAGWFTQLGIEGQATIPIQILAKDGRVACVKHDSVEDKDYAVVDRLLAE